MKEGIMGVETPVPTEKGVPIDRYKKMFLAYVYITDVYLFPSKQDREKKR
jgi:hypothetical protein